MRTPIFNPRNHKRVLSPIQKIVLRPQDPRKSRDLHFASRRCRKHRHDLQVNRTMRGARVFACTPWRTEHADPDGYTSSGADDDGTECADARGPGGLYAHPDPRAEDEPYRGADR